MSRRLAWIAAMGATLWLSTAGALGLGDIDVKSKLNQRFSASIPVTSVDAEEAENLLITLAGAEEFARAGIERTDFLFTLKFALKTEGDKYFIQVSSQQIAREPFVAFLLDVRGRSGRMLREYTVLLDPADAPALAKPAPTVKPSPATEFYETPKEAAQRSAPPQTQAVAAPPAASPAVPAAAPTPAPVEAAEPVEPAAAAAPAGTYGPVQGRETLWSIASRLRADPSISMDQVLLAIYTANPKAFDGGINGLRKGSVLEVPSADAQRAVSAAAARSKVAELRGQPLTPRPAKVRPEPKPAPVETAPAATPAPVPEKKTEVVPPAAKPAPKPAAPAPAPAPEPEILTPPPAAEPAPAAVTPPAPEPAETTAAEEIPAEVPAESEPVPAVPPIPVPAQVIAEDESSGPSGLPLQELALGGLVLLLGGAGFVAYRKRQAGKSGEAPSRAAPSKPSAMPAPEPEAAAPVVAKSVRAPSVRDELEKLASTLDTPGPSAPKAAPAPAPAPKMDSTLAMTAQMSAASAPVVDAPTRDFNATQVLEASNASTSKLPDKVDFDVTGQFESETVSINLDTNDPISEAEFHLAYGLYDEAALLLTQAAEKDPANTSIRVKLAEVYFAAAKPVEFQETAEVLKAQLPGPEWQKLAILGQQLCPDAAIFKDVAGGDLGGAVDLSFDEPAAPAALPEIAEPAPAPAASAPVTPGGGNVLDFKLDDFQLPAAEPVTAAPAPAASGGLDFKLEIPEIKAEAPAVPGIDLNATAGLDLNAMQASKPSIDTAPVDGTLSLEDFDLGADSTNISAGDEASTKLDLARAYVDMGDNDMARSLLNEVIQQGSAEQKKEAEALVSRLS